MSRMTKLARILFAVAVVLGLSSIVSTTAYALSTSSVSNYCVTFGHGNSAAGNVVEYNWDQQQCPANTYPHTIGGPVSTTDDDSGFLPNTIYADTVINHAATLFTIVEGNTGVNVKWLCDFIQMGPTSGSDNRAAPQMSCVATSG